MLEKIDFQYRYLYQQLQLAPTKTEIILEINYNDNNQGRNNYLITSLLESPISPRSSHTEIIPGLGVDIEF